VDPEPGLTESRDLFRKERSLFKYAWIGAAVLCSACSSVQLGGAGEQWQNNECRKIIDATERKRCLDSNAKTFEEFRRQQQAGSKP
jgi:hypothetical protein